MASPQVTKRLATRPPRAREAEMNFDLGASLDDPMAGAAWDWPLRLIARFHCAMDVDAPVCFRVCRQFEYCWRLAVKTNKIDAAGYARDVKAWASQKGNSVAPTIPFAVKHMVVSSRREAKKNAFLCKGFEVTRPGSSSESPLDEKPAREIRFLGVISG